MSKKKTKKKAKVEVRTANLGENIIQGLEGFLAALKNQHVGVPGYAPINDDGTIGPDWLSKDEVSAERIERVLATLQGGREPRKIVKVYLTNAWDNVLFID